LKYVQAGPGYYGAGEEFDKKCMFGNLVDMNSKQAMVLNKIVGSALTPMMRYACTMKYETVIPVDCKFVSCCLNEIHLCYFTLDLKLLNY
jgi:hypothetical protein